MNKNNIATSNDDLSGERIKRLRKELNMSMDELSNKTHISKSTISRYEKTGVLNVPIDKVQSIAQALNVSTSYLCGWESKDLPSSYYHSIVPLINEFGYKLEYECNTETFTLKSESCNLSITTEELKILKDSTYSFFKFMLSEIGTKSSTTE